MIELGYETDSIAIPEISPVFLDGNENIPPGRDESIGEIYFLDLQVELCSPQRGDGPPIKETLHIDPSLTGVMEDMVPREVGAEVMVDEHYPQEPKEGKDGGSSERWPVSENRYDGDEDQGDDADI
jgi:hypothetical protein